MSKLRAFALVVSTGLLMAFSVSWIDVALWRHLDQGRAPIRSFVSDQHYYLVRTHRLLEAGHPLGGAYYQERLGDRPRYFLFESLLLAFGAPLARLVGTNPVVWAVVMRALTAFGVFLGLFGVLRRFARWSVVPATLVAALIVPWFLMRSLYMGNSLSSWHLPFTFGGLLLLHAALRRPAGLGRLLRLAGATVLFLTHPIAFAVGAATIGLALLMRMNDERTQTSLFTGVAWTVAALAIGWTAYGAFASEASGEALRMLARNLFVYSHLPGLPLTSLWVAALGVLLFVLARRADPQDRPAWHIFAALTCVSFIGLNLNVLTGTYFLNDHYGFLMPLVPPCAAALALRLTQERPSGRTRAILIICATVLGAWSLRLLSDGQAWQEARAFAHLGTILSFLALCLIGLGIRIRVPERHSSVVAAALIAGAAVLPLASAVAWLDGYRAQQIAIQKERVVVDALADLPPGTVLSDPEHAETVAGYTPHLAYWSAYAFGDDAAPEELRSRWKDALRFFPHRWDVADWPVGTRSLYGYMDLMCVAHWPIVKEEHAVYRFLERTAGFRKNLCRPMQDAEAWVAFVEAERPTEGELWMPEYRLDYLLLDLSKGQALPEGLTDDFELIRETGPLLIYRHRPTS